MYPEQSPRERENLITKEHGCVFLMKIGDKLKSGEPHDGRAPDYDDWQLNGDIMCFTYISHFIWPDACLNLPDMRAIEQEHT